MRKQPFQYYLLASILFLSFTIVIGITIVDYLNAEDNFQKNSEFLRSQTENNIEKELKIVDDGLKLFDSTLNNQMKQGFTLFFDEYDRAGKNLSRMNLQGVKDQLDGKMDLYVINEFGVIEFTTFLPDQGLDFKKIPYFYEYLTRIRQSEGFFPDRVVRELSTGQFKKFAYMPTSDHKYILEIGFASELIAR